MMDVAAINVVFRCIITEQTQTEKICRARQEFERGKITFIEASDIGPHPANAIPFQEADKLPPMPSGTTKFNRETAIRRQLLKKLAQPQFAVSSIKVGR